LTLHASVRCADASEWAMLMQALECLGLVVNGFQEERKSGGKGNWQSFVFARQGGVGRSPKGECKHPPGARRWSIGCRQ
jgi:hypothetical protein